MVCTFFEPITNNFNYKNHSLLCALQCLVPEILIFMTMYTHIFLVALSTRATLQNTVKRSIIKQKGRFCEIAVINIFSYIYVEQIRV